MRELFEDQAPVTTIFARLDEQDAMLREHGRKLDEHRRILEEHGGSLLCFEQTCLLLEQNRAAIIAARHQVELLRIEVQAQRRESGTLSGIQRKEGRSELQTALDETIRAEWRVAISTAVLLSIPMSGLVVFFALLLSAGR